MYKKNKDLDNINDTWTILFYENHGCLIALSQKSFSRGFATNKARSLEQKASLLESQKQHYSKAGSKMVEPKNRK